MARLFNKAISEKMCLIIAQLSRGLLDMGRGWLMFSITGWLNFGGWGTSGGFTPLLLLWEKVDEVFADASKSYILN